MKHYFLVAVMAAGLTACSAIPSFYDDNESMLAVNVRMSVDYLDCEKNATSQSQVIANSVNHLYMYSESKGSDDVHKMVGEMKQTADGLANKQTISPAFCKIKKTLLEQQSKTIADAVMRRF